MDKVKIALALLKKYHFWVMTLAVVLLACVGWLMATKKLWDDYLANKAQIDQRFKEMSDVRSEPDSKNQDWIKGVEDETVQLKAKVALAWKQAYQHQRDNVLKWPATLAYRTAFEQAGLTGVIPTRALEEYRNYSGEEFPRLLAIVDAKSYRSVKQQAPGGKPSADEPAEHDYKVVWDSKSQEVIYRQLVWDSTPTSDQVREAQENLWVYEALLRIIGGGPDTRGSLNEFASGNYNAKVKRIEELSIGRDAALLYQGGMAEGQKDIEKPEGAVAVAAEPGAAPPPPAEKATEGRYVDEKGTPLAAPAPGAPGETSEFKRMPVFMKLIIDQRELSRLLVVCANSPLPVEVRQFRVHSLPKSKPGAKGAAGAPDKAEPGPYDVDVELMGIISIFNPPDQAKLGPLAALDDPARAPADAKGAPAEAPGASAPAAGPAANQPAQ